MRPPPNCAHCGKTFPPGRPSAYVKGAYVCHADWKGGVELSRQDDCYRLVMIYGESLGSRLPAVS
jgi:hypothetical protein